jgi:pilus assembly protein CpaD
MRSKLVLLLLGSALAGCTTVGHDVPSRGLATVNVPVVTSADYVFDAAAPDGTLAPGEAERLNGWFQTLGIGYGDAIYVDGGYAYAARAQVESVAGQYGMLVQAGSPVTQGAVQPGYVRVVVSRRRATVPGCPNWSIPAQPSADNRSMSNYGCAVSSNFAAMIANPEDLLHGREDLGTADIRTGTKAITTYRTAPQTGEKGLQDISTKKKDSQ